MLDATGHISLYGATYAIHVALERRFRIVTVFRDGLVWDTRPLPPSIRPAQDRYYVLLEGEVTLFGDRPRRVRAPHAFRVRAREDDGQRGRLDVRGEGRPFRLFELHLHPPTIPLEHEETWTDLALSADLVARLDAYERLARGEDVDAIDEAREAMLASLVSAGWLDAELLATMVSDEPNQMQRTWSALSPIFRTLSMTPALMGLADRATVSVRQVDRDFVALLRTFGLAPKGWRATIQRYRLSLAVLLLSADDATIADVSRTVGYARPEAMASAFKAAGLATPSAVQAMLRGR